MKTYTAGELQAILKAHLAWLRNEVGGERAYLRGANLRGANLGGANLSDANLRGAYLRGAYLRDANLRDANLRGANLGGANLRGANLRGANLGGANLRGANLSDAKVEDNVVMPGGYTFAVYKSEVVPALLTAGGKSLAEVVGAWECHEWTNCPMATAFGVHEIGDVPALYREQARLFIQFFDAGLLPKPEIPVAARRGEQYGMGQGTALSEKALRAYCPATDEEVRRARGEEQP